MPSPVNPPSGCHFHTRCWLRERLGNPERCAAEVPLLRELSTGHEVACHFAEEVDGLEGAAAVDRARRGRPGGAARRAGDSRARRPRDARRRRHAAGCEATLGDPARRPRRPPPRSLDSGRAGPSDRPRPARAPPRGPRGEPRAPPRAARRGAGGRRRPRRVPGARPDRLPAPGPRGRGRDAARRPAARRARRGDGRRLSAVVSFVEESGGPPPVHRGGPARGRRDPPRPPQGVPADLRPVRRAAVLRPGRPAARRAVAARASASGSRCARTSGTSRRPSCSRSTGRRSWSTCRRRRAGTSRATNEVGLGTATSWRTLMRTYAQLTTSFVVFCNRVGVDESISFWGGSEVIAPTGEARVLGAAVRRGAVLRGRRPRRRAPGADLAAAAARRAAGAGRPRVAAAHRRAGGARATTRPPSPAPRRVRRRRRRRRGAARRDVAVDRAGATEPRPSGDRRHGAVRPARRARDRHRTSRAGSSPSSSAASCARRASSGPCSGCRAGSTRRSSRTSSPRRSGAERLLCVLMPYRTSSPASRGDAEEVVRRLGCASELVEITPMVDGYFGADGVAGRGGRGGPRGVAAPAGQLHGPDADERALRPLGRLARARRRDRQQDRVADRLHDAVRRLGVRVQPDRRPVQEPGPPAVGGDRRARGDHPQGAVGGPVARARPTRPRPASPTTSSTGCCSGGSTSGGPSTRWSRWASTGRLVERVDRMVAGAEFKRQVPPIAKLGPRTAGVDYLYPRRRPGSARP